MVWYAVLLSLTRVQVQKQRNCKERVDERLQHNMRKERREKNNPPTMPLRGYSVGAGKNTLAHKHIHLKHDLQRVGRGEGR